jgi:uncharacterized membrane protein YfcA
MMAGWLYPLLFLTGFAAGFVDSIAGGGGLITVPVLLNIGLSPVDALGTNKLQATFGSASAAWHYGRAGLFEVRRCLWGIGCTLVGAGVGTALVRLLREDFLRQSIPWLLVAVALYTLFRRRLGEQDVPPLIAEKTFHVVFGLLLGFYDGFFGPGTGTFWAMAYVLLLGFNLTKATAHTKVMNVTSNVASLAIFLAASHAHFGAGVSMGLGQLLGARVGSRTVLRRGTKFIRPVFITVVLAVTARLVYQNFSGAGR